jgi:hypothetical protein
MPLTLVRNGWFTENSIDQMGQYLAIGEILGGAANGRISAASRQDSPPPPPPRRSLKARAGTGRTSSVAQPSTYPSSRGSSPRSPSQR